MERDVSSHSLFTLRTACALYKLFTELDTDGDGMLTCGC
jgi:hypothetical protein